MPKPSFLIVVGPSGVGKTCVADTLQNRDIVHVLPSWTTRPPRPHELSHQVDHIFASEAQFTDKAEAGYFLEQLPMFGLPYRYGLPALATLPDTNSTPIPPLVILRTPLIPLLQKHYNRSDYVIYAIADQPERIESRLRARQDDGEQLGDRVDSIKNELRQGSLMADRVFNNSDTVEGLVEHIVAAIQEDFHHSNEHDHAML